MIYENKIYLNNINLKKNFCYYYLVVNNLFSRNQLNFDLKFFNILCFRKKKYYFIINNNRFFKE